MSEYDALVIEDPLADYLADLERAANLGRWDPIGQEVSFAAAERDALLCELVWRRQTSVQGLSRPH